MSATDHVSPSAAATPVADGSTDDRPPRPWPGGGPRRRRVLLAAGATAALALAVTTLLVTRSDQPPPAPDAPLVLPATATGLSALPQKDDPTRRPDFGKQVDEVRRAAGGATVVAHTYGAASGGRSVRIVVGRTDLTEKLDLTWAADSGREVGDARCTNNTMVTPLSPPRVRPTLMLCWRTSQHLSVYALIIDPKATSPVAEADGAAAVAQAWKAAAGRG